jgi:DNA polymerase-3 subunit delta
MAASGLTIDNLEQELRAGRIAPLYLFYGEEGLLIDEAVQRVVDAILPPGERAFNFDVLSGNDADARDIVARASSFPMMAERRVVIVREVDRLPEKGLELLAHYAQQPLPSTCLILVASKPDMRRKAFTAVKRTGMAVEFRELYENQLPGWIDRRVMARRGSIDPEASKLLAAYVGSSLRDIDNELDKLFLYIGKRTAIKEEDVAAVVGFTREFSVFELQKAIGERDLRRAVEVMEKILDANEPMPLLVSILTNYLATLWKMGDLLRRGTKQSDLTALVRVNPYFLKEYLAALRKYTMEEVEEAFHHLATADEQSKTAGADLKAIVHRFLLNVMLPERELVAE